MEPLLPSEHALGPLLEHAHAHALQGNAYRLDGFCAPNALRDLRTLLRAMNSYYTNKIEGQHTLPLEIAQALGGDFSDDADKARRQRLAVAHMACEQQLEARWAGWSAAEVWAPQMVADIHQDLFARLPAADRLMDDGETLEPGDWRSRDVLVGGHAAPAFTAIVPMLARWGTYYGGVRRGQLQVLAALAAHQRLAWIHPFRDGNGRVARLHTHLVLGKLGLTNGLWSPLRGFALTQTAYYEQLAAADEPLPGDLDGRGNLTEKGFISWIGYVLQTCLDQVQFMEKSLRLDGMRDRMAACLAYEENVVKRGCVLNQCVGCTTCLPRRRSWSGASSRRCWHRTAWATGWLLRKCRRCSSGVCWRPTAHTASCAWACRSMRCGFTSLICGPRLRRVQVAGFKCFLTIFEPFSCITYASIPIESGANSSCFSCV